MNRIITVGREFGSGGREIGRKIAQELGIAYYDHEIVTELISPHQFGGRIHPQHRGEEPGACLCRDDRPHLPFYQQPAG